MPRAARTATAHASRNDGNGRGDAAQQQCMAADTQRHCAARKRTRRRAVLQRCSTAIDSDGTAWAAGPGDVMVVQEADGGPRAGAAGGPAAARRRDKRSTRAAVKRHACCCKAVRVPARAECTGCLLRHQQALLSARAECMRAAVCPGCRGRWRSCSRTPTSSASPPSAPPQHRHPTPPSRVGCRAAHPHASRTADGAPVPTDSGQRMAPPSPRTADSGWRPRPLEG
jgi:hypothetical protein